MTDIQSQHRIDITLIQEDPLINAVCDLYDDQPLDDPDATTEDAWRSFISALNLKRGFQEVIKRREEHERYG